MKKLIASVTVAASLLTVGTGLAAAQEPADPGPTATSEGRGGHHRLLREALQVAADTVGVTAEELRAALEGGQTIAQVAQSNDVDQQQVVDAIVQAATQKLDEAVASGRVDETRAAKTKERLPQLAQRIVTSTRTDREARRGDRRERRQTTLETAASAIGVAPDELREALKSGKSIADVAQDKGVQLSKVTDALVAEATKRIDAAVEQGRIDEAKAGELKGRLAERVDKVVHHTFGQRDDRASA